MNTKWIFMLSASLLALPLTAVAADVKPVTEKKSVSKRVDVEEFDKLRQDKANVVLDVRTAAEFKAGHIPGAVNVDVNDPGFSTQLGKLDKGKTYLVHCAAGMRSAKACGRLESAGFTNLFDLAPGFRAWEKAGKPVER
jgi:phage shock protein E